MPAMASKAAARGGGRRRGNRNTIRLHSSRKANRRPRPGAWELEDVHEPGQSHGSWVRSAAAGVDPDWVVLCWSWAGEHD